MNALLDQVYESDKTAEAERSQSRDRAFDAYVALLQRADSPQPGDAESLRAIMADLNLSADDVAADAEAVRRLRALKALHATYDDKHARLASARENLDATKKRIQAELQTASRGYDDARHEWGQVASARQDAASLAERYPRRELFAPGDNPFRLRTDPPDPETTRADIETANLCIDSTEPDGEVFQPLPDAEEPRAKRPRK